MGKEFVGDKGHATLVVRQGELMCCKVVEATLPVAFDLARLFGTLRKVCCHLKAPEFFAL